MSEEIIYDLGRGDPLYVYADGLRAIRNLAESQVKNYIPALDVYSMLSPIGAYLHEQLGYPAFAGGLSLRGSLFPTVGTTGGFRVALRAIKKLFDETYRLADKKMVPVFIAPAPTYGNFLDGAADLGFEVVTVKRRAHENWALSPADLADTFAKVAGKAHRQTMVYFDSSPNNPTGLIRGAEETEAQARVLMAAKRAQTKANFDLYRQTRKLADPLAEFWVIDDIVYHGTEYGPKKTHLFARCPALQGSSFTLLGPSKIGLAGLRAGVLVAPTGGKTALAKLKKYMFRHLFLEQGYPSVDALQALLYCYSVEKKNKTALDAHLTKMNEAHAQSGFLLKALVNGLEASGASPQMQEKLVALVAEERGVSLAAARAEMEKPLTHIQVVTAPESGFFHILSFENMKGRFVGGPAVVSKGVDEPVKIKDDQLLGYFLMRCGLEIGKPSYYGFEPGSFLTRASYAFAPKEILAIADRLRVADDLAQPTRARAKKAFTANQKTREALELAF